MSRISAHVQCPAPAFIERFYKHQSSGKHMIQSSGLSPDQTDYRPILKERAARIRLQNASNTNAPNTNANTQVAARDAASIPTKTQPIPVTTILSPPAHASEPQLHQNEAAQTNSKTSAAPLDGCESDEGYFSDMIIRGQRL